jgi:hypothetical protein
VLDGTKVSVIEHGAWSEVTEEDERKHSTQHTAHSTQDTAHSILPAAYSTHHTPHSLTSAVRGGAPADFDAAFSNAGLAASMLHAELSRRLRRFEATFESAFPEHSKER